MAELPSQDEKKREDAVDCQLDMSAQVTMNKDYRLPFTKLSLSGTVLSNPDESTQIVRRSILFVIDKSGSMVHTYLPYYVHSSECVVEFSQFF